MPLITLLKPHTHARKLLAAGTEIEVPAATADWLVNHKIGRRGAAKSKSESKPVAVAPATQEQPE